MGTRRLTANGGTGYQMIGSGEQMWLNLLVGRRRGIEPTLELVDLPRARPKRELLAEVVGIYSTGKL
jgi:hypothetical protein